MLTYQTVIGYRPSPSGRGASRSCFWWSREGPKGGWLNGQSGHFELPACSSIAKIFSMLSLEYNGQVFRNPQRPGSQLIHTLTATDTAGDAGESQGGWTRLRCRVRSRLCASVVVALLLPACSTLEQGYKDAKATIEQRFRPSADDPNDPCRPQRAALDQTGNHFSQSLIDGPLAILTKKISEGILTGRIPDSRALTIGVATSSIKGLATGYWLKQLDQTQNNQAALLTNIAKDLKVENEQIDRTQTALDELVRCRHREADVIRSDLAAGRVDRTEAQTRMAAVRQRYDQDLEIARKISANVKDRGANFQFANEQVNPQPYLAVRNAVLRADSNVTSRDVGDVRGGTVYSASRADDQWFKVFLPDGRQGFVEVEVLTTPSPQPVEPAPPEKTAEAPPEKTAEAPPEKTAEAPPEKTAKAPPPKTAKAPPPKTAKAAPPKTAKAPPPKSPPAQTIPVKDREINESTSTNLAKRDRLAESIQTAGANTGAFELSSG